MKLRIYNSTLEPNLWDTETKVLKPKIRDKLLEIAESFYNETGLKSEIQNILFLGSSCNFNWSPKSDIDLHIILDISAEKINEEYARKFMDSLAFKWNTEHDVEIKGHPVEIYLQDIREPNSNPQLARKGGAIYSIYDGKWLLEPDRQNIKLDPDKIRKKFDELKKRIDELIQTEDIEKLKALMKSIRNYRDVGLSKGGEISTENIVFKGLRKSGDLTKLKDAINTIYDRKVSLPETGNIIPTKKTSQENLTKENITKKSFLIVGIVDEDFEVECYITYKDDIHHNILGMYMRSGRVGWRYRSLNNTIYWRENPNEKQKYAVMDELNRRYGVKNPLQSYNGLDYVEKAHSVNENNLPQRNFLVVGTINNDLKIKAEIDYIGSRIGPTGLTRHGIVHPESRYGYVIRWRYKSKDNTLYWTCPDDYYDQNNPDLIKKQREEVVNYLKEKYNVVNPQQLYSIEKYFDRGGPHYVNESIIDKNAKLFLGFIRRDNFKIIVRSIEDNEVDDVNHINWSFTLPPELKWGNYESNKFRYRKDKNTVYWWSHELSPTEDEKTEINHWIEKNFCMKNPEHKIILSGNTQNYYDAHTIDESVNRESKLIIGLIKRENFKIIGMEDKGDESHNILRMLVGYYDWEDDPEKIIPWRYKKNTNTLYFWKERPHPTEDEINEIKHWLEKNIFIDTNQKLNVKFYGYEGGEIGKNYDDAHSFNENTNLPKNKVILGEINDDLEITNVHVGGNRNHIGNGTRWRYKFPYPVLFWWDEPTEKQKDQVADFLKNKWNIDIKKHFVAIGDWMWSDGNKDLDHLHNDKDDLENNGDQYLKEITAIVKANLKYNFIC